MKSYPVLTLSGYAKSGKDTVAELIYKHYNAIPLALADPMKRAMMGLFGFTLEEMWGPSERRSQSIPWLNKYNEDIKQSFASKLNDEDKIRFSLILDVDA
jgi:hypothetical protein